MPPSPPSVTAPTIALSSCAGTARECDDRLRAPRRLQPVLLGDLPRSRGVAWANGYAVVAGSSDGSVERGDAILKRLIGGRVDGLVVVPAGGEHTVIAEEVGRGTPVVLLDLEVDDLTVSTLSAPTTEAVRAVPWSTSSPTAIATSPSSATCRRSSRPVSATGATSRRCALHGSSAGPTGRSTASTRSPPPMPSAPCSLDGVDAVPSALFTAQNFVTIGAVQALHELGLHRSIAIVAFDDVDMADVVDPASRSSPTAGGPRAPRRRGCSSTASVATAGGRAGPSSRTTWSSGVGEIARRRSATAR